MSRRRERVIIFILLLLLLALQYPLWLGNGNLINVWRLKQEIKEHKEQNTRLQERNRALAAEVLDLKQGQAAIEERARSELGMVKKDETFFQVIEPEEKQGTTPQ